MDLPGDHVNWTKGAINWGMAPADEAISTEGYNTDATLTTGYPQAGTYNPFAVFMAEMKYDGDGSCSYHCEQQNSATVTVLPKESSECRTGSYISNNPPPQLSLEEEMVVVDQKECVPSEQPGGDCVCSGYPAEPKRSSAQIGGVSLLAVGFRNKAQIVSGYGKNFGCWYRASFRSPKGYRLYGYQFQTVTGFGYCELRWNSPSGPNVPGPGEPDVHGQNYQECGPLHPPEEGAEVSIQYRIKGRSVPNVEEIQHGGFLVTVYLQPL